MIAAEIIGQVKLAGGALLYAHRGVVELQRRAHLQRFTHHEALTVVEVDGGEVEPERGVARQRPGRIARQHVDLAGLQGGEAILRGQRHELDLGRIVEDRRGDGAAKINVETGPIALRIGQAEARQRPVGAADQLTAILDATERLGPGRMWPEESHRCQSHCRSEPFHDQTFQDGRPRPRQAVLARSRLFPRRRHLRTIALQGQGLTRTYDAEVMAQAAHRAPGEARERPWP